MQNADWERSIYLKTNFLMEEYRKIVAEFFPAGIDLPTFVDIFSKTFRDYQDNNQKKLDPESIREKKISCSSAAALLGLWWMTQFPQLTPIFLIEETDRNGTQKSAAHVNVAIPTTKSITTREAMEAFYRPNTRSSDVQIIDWTAHSAMKQSNPAKLYDVAPVVGLQAYLKNRLVVLGLPSKYSSKNLQRMLLGNDREEVGA